MVHAESQSIKVTEILAHYFDTLSNIHLNTLYIVLILSFIKNYVLIFFCCLSFPISTRVNFDNAIEIQEKTHSMFSLKMYFIYSKKTARHHFFFFFRPSNFFCRPNFKYCLLYWRREAYYHYYRFPFFTVDGVACLSTAM